MKSYPLENNETPSPVLACTIASGSDGTERLMWANANGIIKVIDINVNDFVSSSSSEESSEDYGTFGISEK